MSRYDYRDPGTDPDYCNQLGGHPGIPRTCATCQRIVFVSRDEEYRVRVVCDHCNDEAVRRG